MQHLFTAPDCDCSMYTHAMFSYQHQSVQQPFSLTAFGLPFMMTCRRKPRLSDIIADSNRHVRLRYCSGSAGPRELELPMSLSIEDALHLIKHSSSASESSGAAHVSVCNTTHLLVTSFCMPLKCNIVFIHAQVTWHAHKMLPYVGLAAYTHICFSHGCSSIFHTQCQQLYAYLQTLILAANQCIASIDAGHVLCCKVCLPMLMPPKIVCFSMKHLVQPITASCSKYLSRDYL